MAVSAIQVRLSQEHKSITVGRLGESIAKLAQSLREIDKAYTNQVGGLSRAEWVVNDLSLQGRDIVIQIGPSLKSGQRNIDSLNEPVRFFMNGLEGLEQSAELPEYYSENTIRHILDLGAKKGNSIRTTLSSVNGQVGEAVLLGGSLLDNARKAIRGNYETVGSIVGRLDILDGRHGNKGSLRSSILDESSHRGVTALIPNDRQEQLRKLWNTRVLLFGEITKNDAGQAIKILVSEVENMPPEGPPGRDFRDLLGVAPNWAEGMDSVNYLRSRRGA